MADEEQLREYLLNFPLSSFKNNIGSKSNIFDANGDGFFKRMPTISLTCSSSSGIFLICAGLAAALGTGTGGTGAGGGAGAGAGFELDSELDSELELGFCSGIAVGSGIAFIIGF